MAQGIYLEAVTEKSNALFALFSLRPLMQRPENSNLFCCFLAWRLADYISQRSYNRPLRNNHPFLLYRVNNSRKRKFIAQLADFLTHLSDSLLITLGDNPFNPVGNE